MKPLNIRHILLLILALAVVGVIASILWHSPASPVAFIRRQSQTAQVSGGSSPTIIFLTSGSTWVVPSDWNSSENTIEVIGGGGGGAGGGAASEGYGGGGGGYSIATNVSLTPGATVGVNVGIGGAAGQPGGTGGDTYVCNSNSDCTGVTASPVVVGAYGGTGGTSSQGGSGGADIGTGYPGGAGGSSANSDGAGSGGGGAGGPNGKGGDAGGFVSSAVAGSGGGGNGGGNTGGIGSASTPGTGGNNYLGSGSGSAPGGAGSNGGGGGAGAYATNGNAGGAGGNGAEWTTAGSGGGGGGGSESSTGSTGGNGGLYGAGGGGAGYSYGNTTSSVAGNGAQGIIVITYTPTGSGSPPPSDTTPPSVPTGLFATAVSSSQINLSWTASTDNVGVTGYNIYRNSSKIATSATNSYSDTGLSASTQYTYTVSAYDAANNTSAQSTGANATTQIVIVSAGGVTIPADTFINMSGGTNGQQVTTAILNNSTIGPSGTWSISATGTIPGYLNLVSSAIPTGASMLVGGVSYPIGGTQNIFQASNATTINFAQYYFSTPHSFLTASNFFSEGDTEGTFQTIDNEEIDTASGNYCVPNMFQNELRAHTGRANYGSAVGPNIAIAYNHLYWMTLTMGFGNCQLVLYDPENNWSIVGSSAISVYDNYPVVDFRFGRTDGHGGTQPPFGQYNDYGDIALDFTNPGFPIDDSPLSGNTPATYTLTPTAGGNGSISPGTAVTINSGSNQTFTITPNSGYQVSSLTVDGVSAGATTSYAFSNVTTNHTISATFSPVTASSIAWVSPTGTASWASCGGSTALSGTAACSLATANANVSAGDTVEMRGGTYNTGIAPAQSGTSGNAITYQAYTGETPLITGITTAINVSGKSFVTVNGITAKLDYTFANFANASHDQVNNSVMTDSDDPGSWPVGVIMYPDSQYNVLNNDTIGVVGRDVAATSSPSVLGGVIELGDVNNANDTTAYNLIENSTLYDGAHYVLSLAGQYNVVSNNTFHNEDWTPCQRPSTNNLCGDRDVIIENSYSQDARWNVIEGNRLTFGGYGIDAGGGSGLSDREQHAIIRNNMFYFNDGVGLGFYTDNSGYYDPSDAHAYNNVFYGNGASAFAATQGIRYTYGANFDNVSGNNSPTQITGVDFKNNIFYNNTTGDLFYYYTDPTQQTLAGNYFDVVSGSNALGRITPSIAGNIVSLGNPLFSNVSAAESVANINAFDFHLQAGSPAINEGVFLTTTTGAGSGTVIPVADAAYFTNGFGIVPGDVIQLQGQTQTANIVSINYVANQITVNTPLSWTSGLGVSLPYSGSAPDPGAYEYGAVSVSPVSPAINTPSGAGGGTTTGGSSGGGTVTGTGSPSGTNCGSTCPVSGSTSGTCPQGFTCTPLSPSSPSWTTLVYGMTSPTVKLLQIALNKAGYIVAVAGPGSPGHETTYFGKATLTAVKRYQCTVMSRCSGPLYGTVDLTTAQSLKLTTTTATADPSATFSYTLKEGSAGAEVKELQIFLNGHGFTVASTGNGSPGHETTYFGPATKAALIRFQDAYTKEILTPLGLTQGTGIFGPSTIKGVNILLGI